MAPPQNHRDIPTAPTEPPVAGDTGAARLDCGSFAVPAVGK